MLTYRLFFAAFLCALVGVLSAGCGDDEREPTPTPPNMNALVAAYDSPTAILTQDNAASTLIAAVSLFDVFVESDGLTELVLDLLGGAFGGGEEDAQKSAALSTRTQAISLEADGFVRITRICNGWDGGTSPNPADGSINLTAVATSSGLNPVVWGSMAQCKYSFADADQVLFDSSLSIHIGNVGSGGEGLGQSPLLISLQGIVQTGDTVLDNGYDFRINLETGLLEIRVPLEDGRHVILIPSEEGILLNAQNGLWTCDLEGRSCTSDSGEVIAW